MQTIRTNDRAGTRRLVQPCGAIILALATHLTIAEGQTVSVVARGRVDTAAGTLDSMTLARARETLATLRRVDSLRSLQDAMPIGSPEYRRIGDELQATIKIVQPAGTTFVGSDGNVVLRRATGSGTAPRAGMVMPRMATDMIPKGWLGMHLDGYHVDIVDATGSYVRYYQYPAIVSIDPNSPASKVGLQFGDSVLAYDGQDLRTSVISLNRLLEPGHKLDVKVRQDGETKMYSLTVAVAPADVIAERVAESSIMMSARAPVMLRDSTGRREVEAVQGRAIAGGRGVPLATAKAGFAMKVPTGILGARLVDLSPDAISALTTQKASHGVLIAEVTSGSPAERTGLHAGDVIVSVGDVDVTSISQLYREVFAPGVSRPTVFIVLRSGKTEKLSYDPR